MDDVSLSESLYVNEISTLQLELDTIYSWAGFSNNMKLMVRNAKKC